MDSKFITKINVDDNILYIDFNWIRNDKDLFSVTVYDSDSAWSGVFPVAEVDSFRENVDESEHEYLTNIEKAARGEHNLFSYQLDPVNDDTAKFIWKRIYKSENESNVLLLHGFVTVYRDISKNQHTLIDILINENKCLKFRLKERESDQKKMIQDLATYKEELEMSIKAKSILEEELYSKFVQVLNAKKKLIRLLQKQFSELESNNH